MPVQAPKPDESKVKSVVTQAFPKEGQAIVEQLSELNKKFEALNLQQTVQAGKKEIDGSIRGKKAQVKRSKMFFALCVTAAVFVTILGIGVFAGGIVALALAPATSPVGVILFDLGFLGGILGGAGASGLGCLAFDQHEKAANFSKEVKEYGRMKRNLDDEKFLDFAKENNALATKYLKDINLNRLFEAKVEIEKKDAELAQLDKMKKGREEAIQKLDLKNKLEQQEKADLQRGVSRIVNQHRSLLQKKNNLINESREYIKNLKI